MANPADSLSLSSKLDILKLHANDLTTNLREDLKSYLEDVKTALDSASGDNYKAIYNMIVNKFGNNGVLSYEYPSGTVGEYLIGCAASDPNIPEDIRACLASCLNGVRSPGMPSCQYQVWEENTQNGKLMKVYGSGTPLVFLYNRKNLTSAEARQLPGAKVYSYSDSDTINKQQYSSLGWLLLIIILGLVVFGIYKYKKADKSETLW